MRYVTVGYVLRCRAAENVFSPAPAGAAEGGLPREAEGLAGP